MNSVENVLPSATSEATVSTDSGRQTKTDMAAVQLSVAEAGKVEAEESVRQIEVAQTRKQEFVTVLRAARELRRAGVRGGQAASSEYMRALEACRHARKGKGSIPIWLLKFFRSHGIFVESPSTAGNSPVDTWSTALDILQNLQVVNAFCDLAGIAMPSSEDMAENLAEWDSLIRDLQAKLDDLGAEISARLARLQDTVGQYDSLLWGADTTINK
ncbi:MAG: hypothetical protein K5657_08325 [Desulfovibrio sp.]|nr:hypothetical protein [Desulfovibrio sp.]